MKLAGKTTKKGAVKTVVGAVSALTVGSILLAVLPPQGAGALTTTAANKVAFSGSALEVVGPKTDDVIMEGTLKTSSPTDLMVQVALECALFTDTSVRVANGQKSSAEATSRVEVWVEVDPTPADPSDDNNNAVLPVAGNDITTTSPADIGLDNDVPPQASKGRVVFCHRTQGLVADFSNETALTSDDNFIRLYQGSREASAFNWLTLDSSGLGSGTYGIEVHAQIVNDTQDVNAASPSAAKGTIGKRTLIVEPTKLQNSASI